MATSEMISSGAFPKLALSKAPMPGPVYFAACSVASPINQASGTSAAAASGKTTRSSAAPDRSRATTSGPSASRAMRIRRTTSSAS